ncbi:DUF3106 domain-containing protein [Burkholderia pseudomultivorans]|uniref:Membrane protein n=1 Tax=Burkholderia pseudomultivorans TaxID=1207504 RepID=A0A6P2K9D6_9BURK|nr:DUF3106 domain-containing protein [Burkholderia pseudomultivorans]MDR8728631.1 hypothetical protein [Burkholderia pseudomultivorans]MDR8736873.1 hypothetical protein [Burkholderia pseudomultivorans]MDR8743323.1 hypothetical protein [Burkholderia pseudomultivorans]MDR8754922.1 hypothetical protein [Burkholderia pseudomultivorans]MDR8779588.1 hypothetical protein [Burkholderia pseudomultivorans]
MSQKRGLAVFFGCVIAAAVAYVATYPRFHPPAETAAVATSSAVAPASSAAALTADLAPLPLPLPAATGPLSWSRLTPAQHAALAPFADQWDGFSDARKRKWLKIASRFQKMTPDAQKRLQERMTEWARMTPEQRRVARENYQSAKELSAQARERAWKAYQQLPEEQKERLAAAERRRRPSVVSAPPTGADRDVRRLVNAHERPASGAAAAPSPASTGAAAPPAVASSTAGAASVPATVTPVSPADAPSLFKGS